MKSIAVTKPDMGVLPRERLLLSPFGTLAQAFAEELLARARQEEGAWSHVPLELLEEGETAPAPAAPANVTFQMDLRLVLEALRREGEQTEQRQAAQRIVERVLQIQAQRKPPRQVKESVTAPTGTGSMRVLGTVRQEFHQNLTLNIHITQSLPRESDLRDRRMPGDLARQAEAFSRRLQTLREEGAALPRQTGRDGGDGFQLYAGAGSDASEQAALPPREALRLLEEQGTSEARTAAKGLDREGRRLLERLTETLEGAEKSAPEARRKNAAGKGTGPEENPGRRVLADSGVPAAEEMTGGRTLPTAARNIRVSPAGRLGRGKFPAQTEMSTAEERTQVPTQPPVDLSHRTEPDTGSRDSGTKSHRERPGEARQTGGEVTQSAGKKPQSSALTGQSPRQEHDPIGVGQMPTQARDIRVGPEGRPGWDETAGRPESVDSEQEAQTHVPAQPPVELTHRTEPETGEGIPWDRRTGRDRETFGGRSNQDAAEKQEARPVTGRRPERERTESGEIGGPQAGVRQMPTQARDIRVGPEGRPGWVGITGRPESVASEQEAQTHVSAQPPVELTHRTEPETGEGIPWDRRTGRDRETFGGRSDQDAAEKQEARPVTGRRPERERTESGEIGGPQAGVRRMPTQARDIRVGPESRLGRDETFGRPGAVASEQQRAVFGPETRSDGFTQPLVELAYRTEEEADVEAAMPPQTAVGRAHTAQKSSDRSLPPEWTAVRSPRSGESLAMRAKNGTAAAPAGRGLYTAARDIRTGARRRLGGVPGTGILRKTAGDLSAGGAASDAVETADLEQTAQAAARSLPLQELELNLSGTAGYGGAPEESAFQTGAAGDRSGREPTRPEPLPLTYGPGQPASARQPERSGEPRTGETDYVRSLPDWARRFLWEGAPETPGSRVMGVARDIASLPQTEPKDTVQWTAPGYRPPEAPMAYREKERTQPQEGGEVHISDAEIHRTADKVYRIIEERLRRERRRLGF